MKLDTAEDVLHWVFEAYNRAGSSIMRKADTAAAERLALGQRVLTHYEEWVRVGSDAFNDGQKLCDDLDAIIAGAVKEGGE